MAGSLLPLSSIGFASVFETKTDDTVSGVYENYTKDKDYRKGCTTGKSAISFSPQCKPPTSTSGAQEVSYTWTPIPPTEKEFELGCANTNCTSKEFDPFISKKTFKDFWKDSKTAPKPTPSNSKIIKSHCLGSLIDDAGFTEGFNIKADDPKGYTYYDYYVYIQTGTSTCKYIGFNLNETPNKNFRHPSFKGFDDIKAKFPDNAYILYIAPDPVSPNKIKSGSQATKRIDIEFTDDKEPYLYYK